MPTKQQIIDKLNSLEALLNAGLSECLKVRKMIQGDVSTSAAGQSREELRSLAKQSAAKRIQRIKSKVAMSILLLVLLSSCTKEYSTEGCGEVKGMTARTVTVVYPSGSMVYMERNSSSFIGQKICK